MFERFTESARRTLFFARLAAHEIGGDAIGVEHVCLGFLRERHTGLTHDLLGPATLSYERACAEVEAAFGQRQALPTETEIPLTDSVQQLLRRAVAEADALQHSYVGTEHLLLALLQEERPLVTAILGGGLNADSAREAIVRKLDPSVARAQHQKSVEDQISRIEFFLEQLAQSPRDSGDAQRWTAGIRRELEDLRRRSREGPDR